MKYSSGCIVNRQSLQSANRTYRNMFLLEGIMKKFLILLMALLTSVIAQNDSARLINPLSVRLFLMQIGVLTEGIMSI